MRTRLLLSIALTLLIATPVAGQDEETGGPGGVERWGLPGLGAGPLVVNPADGSIWIFFHQTHNLVALDGSDGSVLLDIPLTISPSALAFTPDGAFAFLVGEPLDDQIIDRGVVLALDPSDGHTLVELALEGACNAVHVTADWTVYIACGMQYAYQGRIYSLSWNFLPPEDVFEASPVQFALEMEAHADCGKIPWAIAEYDGRLYVTDLELQWSAQPDGSMGPPYGAWVWVYDSDTLEFTGQEWVGISPNRLANTEAGVLVACSGSKQTEGAGTEPAFSLIRTPGETEPIRLGSAGASDLAVSPGGTWAVATLADWGLPAPGSVVAALRQLAPERFPEARLWRYTGDVALISLSDGQLTARRVPVLEEGFLRAVAISADGARIYALEGDPERILVVPWEMLESASDEPLVSGE